MANGQAELSSITYLQFVVLESTPYIYVYLRSGTLSIGFHLYSCTINNYNYNFQQNV